MEKNDEKDTVRLPREHNIELRNPSEPQRLFRTGDPNLYRTYTINQASQRQIFRRWLV